MSNPAIELVARRVIATSLAYYSLDVSLVEDTEFDRWCDRLHDEWDELDEYTQWKLGSPSEVRASGFHIKCVQRDVFGTVGWLISKGLYEYRLRSNPKQWKDIPKKIIRLSGVPQKPEKRLKGDFLSGRYTTVDNFGWNQKERIQ